ncbi:MAG: Putative D-alanine--D-alanine ligase [Anaerolinea thermophila]|uniref:Putative D-alanine--D-alanine ligase n=1 Tax=Anaerolinea thermophila TaxID=167964 RepID=A0A101FXW6_9CHLR|nr:MAG: Putative D-alanine--D-alanine ligase [Anaerolinea thermophila]
MKKKKVALLANLKVNAPRWEGIPDDRWDDLDSEKTINAILEAIRNGGYESEFFEGNTTVVDTLPKYKPDICFNICEGYYGDSREAHIPAMLEMLRIPYTGSRVLTLALALDKPMTKRILDFHGLPTPPFQTFERSDEPLDTSLRFPLFVKPSREGTSMGVSLKSVVNDYEELHKQVSHILDRYNQPALVEEYIEGREVTVGLVGNLNGPIARRIPHDPNLPRIQSGLRFLPPMEVDLNPYLLTDAVYSNRLKVALAADLNYICPAPLDEDMVDELNWLAAAVFRVLGALDVARVDFRLDVKDNWKPYILEINPLPGLSPDISDLVIASKADGISHEELIVTILQTALERYNMLD